MIKIMRIFSWIVLSVLVTWQSAWGQTLWIGGTGGNGDDWSISANWDDGVPTKNRDAVIPSSLSSGHKMPIIKRDTVAKARTLDILRSEQGVGKLQILGDDEFGAEAGVLILGDGQTRTSTIDGVLNIGVHGEGNNATLKIDGDHTIEGAGGVITLTKSAVIDENTRCESDRLVIKRSGGTPCDDFPDGLDCNVSIQGRGTINVKLDNRGFVWATPTEDDQSPLVLAHRPKTGTSEGWWIVDAGEQMVISTPVVCACRWLLVDTSDEAGPTLTVTEGGQVSSSGRVDFKHGQIMLNINSDGFCTTGDLYWESVVIGQGTTEPAMLVAQNVSAVFSASACTLSAVDPCQ